MSESDRLHAIFAMIVEGIQLLAADFSTQVDSLPGFVHVPDEVLNTYGDGFLLAKQVLEAGLIDEYQYAKMQELDKALDTIPLYKDYAGALEAMRSSLEWEALRAQASDLLRSLGVEKRAPNLGHIVYVRGR